MQNKYYTILVAVFALSCAEEQMSVNSVTSGKFIFNELKEIRNGTRLIISGENENGVLILKTTEVPVCRLAETGTRYGIYFARWKNYSEKYDCQGGVPKSVGNINIDIQTSFDYSDYILKAEASTNENGIMKVHNIIPPAEKTSAYCGRAKMLFAAKKRQPLPSDDPMNPSMERDQTEVFSVDIKLGTKSPINSITDTLSQQVATKCLRNKTARCVGDRMKSITDRCNKGCESKAGAGYCKSSFDLETSMTDVTEQEKQDAQKRYDLCVEKHGVQNTSTEECKTSCIDQMTKEICPK